MNIASYRRVLLTGSVLQQPSTSASVQQCRLLALFCFVLIVSGLVLQPDAVQED